MGSGVTNLYLSDKLGYSDTPSKNNFLSADRALFNFYLLRFIGNLLLVDAG